MEYKKSREKFKINTDFDSAMQLIAKKKVNKEHRIYFVAMEDTMNVRQKEIDDNYEIFEKLLPDIVDKHKSEYALMRHKSIISYHNSFHEAVKIGNEKYADGLFSIQKVDITPVNLGYFSYV